MKINGKDYKKVKKMNGAQASVATSALGEIDIQAVMSLVSKAYEVFYAKKGDLKLADQLKVLLENANMASAIKSLLKEVKNSRFMIVVAACVRNTKDGLECESFEELARIYSDDTGSAANGGSLRWVSPGEMVQPFEAAFEKIALNEVSELIDTQFGMHILKVEERRKKNVTEQVLRNRVESRLRRQRADREFGQWVRELLEGTYVEYVAEPV